MFYCCLILKLLFICLIKIRKKNKDLKTLQVSIKRKLLIDKSDYLKKLKSKDKICNEKLLKANQA